MRNVAACPLAGVCRDEVFDVTPHVAALTEKMLGDPLSFLDVYDEEKEAEKGRKYAS